MVKAEVHAPMEPPEAGVPIEAQKPDEPLDQVRYPPTPGGQLNKKHKPHNQN